MYPIIDLTGPHMVIDLTYLLEGNESPRSVMAVDGTHINDSFELNRNLAFRFDELATQASTDDVSYVDEEYVRDLETNWQEFVGNIIKTVYDDVNIILPAAAA